MFNFFKYNLDKYTVKVLQIHFQIWTNPNWKIVSADIVRSWETLTRLAECVTPGPEKLSLDWTLWTSSLSTSSSSSLSSKSPSSSLTMSTWHHYNCLVIICHIICQNISRQFDLWAKTISTQNYIGSPQFALSISNVTRTVSKSYVSQCNVG